MLPSVGDARTASAREEVTRRHICDESRAMRGQASDQAKQVGRAGAGNPTDKSTRTAPAGGQIMGESREITGAEPNGSRTPSPIPTPIEASRAAVAARSCRRGSCFVDAHCCFPARSAASSVHICVHGGLRAVPSASGYHTTTKAPVSRARVADSGTDGREVTRSRRKSTLSGGGSGGLRLRGRLLEPCPVIRPWTGHRSAERAAHGCRSTAASHHEASRAGATSAAGPRSARHPRSPRTARAPDRGS